MSLKLATATKDQLRVWKVASKDKHRTALTHVHLDIITKDEETRGYLVATDGYVLAKREVLIEIGVKGPRSINIPREAIATAERVMAKDEHAHIYDDQIVVVKIDTDENTGLEDWQRKAVVAFQSQTSLNFPEYGRVMPETADLPTSLMTIDAAVLRTALDQFKHSGHAVWIHIRQPKSPTDPLILTAFENINGESVAVTAMPIKE